MKVALIASNYYPISDVSCIRIHSYCKALAEYGHDITVLIVYPFESQPKDIIDNFEGVKYTFLSEWDDLSVGRIKKYRSRVTGLMKIMRFVKTQEVDAILSYHDSILTNLFVSLFVRKSIVPYIIDKTEYPYGYSQMNLFTKLRTHLNLRLFDGFIVISDELKKFYRKFSKNVFLLPMTIDPNRYNGVEESTKFNRYIPFIALTFGTHNRDGLYESIVAYHRYTQLAPASSCMKLMLIGDITLLSNKFPSTRIVEEYINKNDLTEKVIFLGKQPISEVPNILSRASCLITTANKYTSGGFPTKLGEYMLSGVPVVATNAGEISNYVENKKDLFLCPVGDLDCVAHSILHIQNHPHEAKAMALRALDTANTKFNAKTYVSSLVDYIMNVKNGR